VIESRHPVLICSRPSGSIAMALYDGMDAMELVLKWVEGSDGRLRDHDTHWEVVPDSTIREAQPTGEEAPNADADTHNTNIRSGEQPDFVAPSDGVTVVGTSDEGEQSPSEEGS
jgi:hypothetical protein